MMKRVKSNSGTGAAGGHQYAAIFARLQLLVGPPEHLLKRGARLTLPAAVCLERWEDLSRLAAEASATDKQVALGLAALNGKAEGLARLLPLGVDLNAFTSGFYSHATPLHHAVWSGCLEAVKVLVEAGSTQPFLGRTDSSRSNGSTSATTWTMCGSGSTS